MKTYAERKDKINTNIAAANSIFPKRKNKTGMPGTLKSGLESLSGMDMNAVNVHFNSPEPALLQAHAYTRGTDIHLGPGQEKHLPHEAWHIVQQGQGRVKPSAQVEGVSINDDAALEREADVMGKLATRPGTSHAPSLHNYDPPRENSRLNGTSLSKTYAQNPVVQRYYSNSDFTMGDEAKFIDQQIERTDFSTSYKAPLEKKAEDYNNLPDLNISTNRKMAIEAGAQQAKVFYSDDQTVQESNTGLEAAGSKIRLDKDNGKTISIAERNPQENRKQLGMVKPKILNDLNNLEDFTGFDVNQCDQVVEKIIGASNRVSVIADNYEKEGDDKAAHQLGGYLASVGDAVNINPDEAVNYAPDRTDKSLADSYARLRPQAIRAKANPLKINEFANPEVAEGFLVQSLSHAGSDRVQASTFASKQAHLEAIQALDNAQNDLDIMRKELNDPSKAMLDRWNEHYAGVVAKDGGDVVTLENYNRDVELNFELQRVFNNLFLRFAQFRDFTWAHTEFLAKPKPVMDSEELKDYIQKAKTAAQVLNNEEDEIVDQYVQALNTANTMIENELDKDDAGGLDSLIYFRMYGAGDQSFHSQWKGTADNPLTVRIRSSCELEKKEVARKLDANTDRMGLILDSSQPKEPWYAINFDFYKLGVKYDKDMKASLQQADNYAKANALNIRVSREYDNWIDNLKVAIANKVGVVLDQNLDPPRYHDQLVDMIKHYIKANEYNVFDFTKEGKAKCNRYKQLQILLPVAERLVAHAY